MPGAFLVAPATLADTDDYVHTHIELTITTYAHLVGSDFAAARRSEFGERAAELARDIAEADAAIAAGRLPRRQHVIARNARGGAVGVLSFGAGIEPWESGANLPHWTPPRVTWALSHLYLAPGAQGTGLAQRMLHLALAANRGAYLWVISANERAARFYARHGFVPDGYRTDTGATWGRMPMYRMVCDPASV